MSSVYYFLDGSRTALAPTLLNAPVSKTVIPLLRWLLGMSVWQSKM